MNTAILLLGANLGDREDTFKKALYAIEKNTGEITGVSSLYMTAAWGVTNQPDFLNQVLLINTQLNPTDLLDKLQKVELLLGRAKREKWHARTIDIDILFYNNDVIDEPDLKVPHPAIASRKFTLEPLAEIMPELIHPIYHKSIRQLLHLCQDTLPVKKISKEERHSA